MSNNRNAVLLWSHQITFEQTIDLKSNWGVELIFEMAEAIKNAWGQVPTSEIDFFSYTDKVREWLLKVTKKDDVVVIQGEYGLTYFMVNWCLSRDLVPVYALTERRSEEIKAPDGAITKISRFCHCGFRVYQKVNII